MLIYHPALDAYHCLFRIIAIVNIYKKIEVDRLRLLDFCLLYPSSIAKFRLQPSQANLRKLTNSQANPYRDPLSLKNAFLELSRIQTAALGCAAATGIIDAKAAKNGIVSRTEIALAETIKQRCESLYEREHVFFQSIVKQLLEMPLYGSDGLKARSGLLEFRYDAT